MPEIPLTRGYVALVDDEDFERFGHLRWQAKVSFSVHRKFVYASRTEYLHADPTPRRRRWRTVQLNRQILRAEPGQLVDFINGDTLDCRRENLRLATRTQDLANTKPRTQTSGFKGVHYDGRHGRPGKWLAQLQVEHRSVRLGYFSTPSDAARAYDAAARKYFGSFARVNYPDEPVMSDAELAELQLVGHLEACRRCYGHLSPSSLCPRGMEIQGRLQRSAAIGRWGSSPRFPLGSPSTR